jgi:hypothetical protein
MRAVEFVLLVIGVTYLVTTSLIFSPFRRGLARIPAIGLVVYCRSCTGFWVGGLLGALGFFPREWTMPGPHNTLGYVTVPAACVIAMAIANLWDEIVYQGRHVAFLTEQTTQLEGAHAQTQPKTEADHG